MSKDIVLPIGVVRVGGGDKLHEIHVTATNSRKSCMEEVKKIFGVGEHIALSTRQEYLWTQFPDVGSLDLMLCWDKRWREPEAAKVILYALYPHLQEVPLETLACRMIGNSAGSASRKDIHAHVLLTTIDAWQSERIQRVVDPLKVAPVKAA